MSKQAVYYSIAMILTIIVGITSVVGFMYREMSTSSVTVTSSDSESSKVSTLTPEQQARQDGGTHVKILDVRKTENCENLTLMEDLDNVNYRYSRCAYFGNVNDTFWWYESK